MIWTEERIAEFQDLMVSGKATAVDKAEMRITLRKALTERENPMPLHLKTRAKALLFDLVSDANRRQMAKDADYDHTGFKGLSLKKLVKERDALMEKYKGETNLAQWRNQDDASSYSAMTIELRLRESAKAESEGGSDE